MQILSENKRKLGLAWTANSGQESNDSNRQQYKLGPDPADINTSDDYLFLKSGASGIQRDKKHGKTRYVFTNEPKESVFVEAHQAQ